MNVEPLVSFAQNGEDIVLWRALNHVRNGVYVDVGGFDPDEDSVTRLFYERGWRGVNVEPVPDFAEKFRQRRPEDEVVQAVITDQPVDAVVLHRFGSSGLSTVDGEIASRHRVDGWQDEEIRVAARSLETVLASSALALRDIHFLKVDVEGAEDQVLRSVDFTRWRPWVLVIESTAPNSTTAVHHEWEPLVVEAGYTFTLFDGLSRFYVADEHPELAAALSYPACVLDGFVVSHQVELQHELEAALARAARADESERLATESALAWRNRAVDHWAEAVSRSQSQEAVSAQARRETERLSRQLVRQREKLQQARSDRNELRREVSRRAARIQKLNERTTRMSNRIQRMSERIAGLQEAAEPDARSKLRRAVRALRGSPGS